MRARRERNTGKSQLPVSASCSARAEQTAGRMCGCCRQVEDCLPPEGPLSPCSMWETVARCQDTSPSSVLTRRHEEQRLIIYKQTPVRRVWLGTSPAFNVTIHEAIRFIAYSIQSIWGKNLLHHSAHRLMSASFRCKSQDTFLCSKAVLCGGK